MTITLTEWEATLCINALVSHAKKCTDMAKEWPDNRAMQSTLEEQASQDMKLKIKLEGML